MALSAPVVSPRYTIAASQAELAERGTASLIEGDMAFVEDSHTTFVFKHRRVRLETTLCYSLLGSPCQSHPECAFDLSLATACMLSQRARVEGRLPGVNLALASAGQSMPDRSMVIEPDSVGAIDALIAWREAQSEYAPITSVPFRLYAKGYYAGDWQAWAADYGTLADMADDYVVPQISAYITSAPYHAKSSLAHMGRTYFADTDVLTGADEEALIRSRGKV